MKIISFSIYKQGMLEILRIPKKRFFMKACLNEKGLDKITMGLQFKKDNFSRLVKRGCYL